MAESTTPKSTLICFFMFLVILPSLHGLPTRKDVSKRNLYNSYQGISNQYSECSNQLDCMPSNVNSTELIQCVQGVCVCYPCFQLDAGTGKCNLSPCFSYDNKSDQCTDKRSGQKEAFLLSLFLSSLGVANFYIDDYILAIIQLGLTFALFSFCFCCCCLCCCADRCSNDCSLCDFEDSCFPSLALISCLGIGFALILAISCWWLIDLIIFGLNERNDGTGCTLRQNL